MQQQQFEFVSGSRAEIVIDTESIRIDDVNSIIVARFPGETPEMGYSAQFMTSMWHVHFSAIKDRPTVHHGKPWKIVVTVIDWAEIQMGEGPNAESYTAFECSDGVVVVRGLAMDNLVKYKLVREREPSVMEKAITAFSERRSLQGT